MDARFDLDNMIHTYLVEKKMFPKLDLVSDLPKSFYTQISNRLKHIFHTRNLFSIEFIRERIIKIKNNRKQLHKLFLLEKIEQRTPVWYHTRTQLITASDFGDALGIEKFGRKGDPKKFYEKKCGFVESTFDSASNIFLQWGVMFEPIATDLYTKRTGIHVHEFGLVKNPNHSYLGASPDGITDLGVMLEIKCPYKRVITEDSFLKQYYYQMQGQLDACNLDECDFLEAKFETYSNEQDFFEDYEKEFDTFTERFQEKGILIKDEAGKSFTYSPSQASATELRIWIADHITENIKKSNIIFWYLEKFSLKRVDRDPRFICNMNNELDSVWRNVLKYKENPDIFEQDFNHKKRTTKQPVKTIKLNNSKIAGALFIQDSDDDM